MQTSSTQQDKTTTKTQLNASMQGNPGEANQDNRKQNKKPFQNSKNPSTHTHKITEYTQTNNQTRLTIPRSIPTTKEETKEKIKHSSGNTMVIPHH